MEEHVVFTGPVSLTELIAYYRLAQIFLCMSEHEGLCIPLLEAMYCQLPILAYAAAGVPDTLGDAGMLVHDKDYPLIAELADLLMEDAALRSQVIHRQQQRVADFAPAAIARRFQGYIEELIAA
jgi:glycosyltransferase involved in cell wall biosynthesis